MGLPPRSRSSGRNTGKGCGRFLMKRRFSNLLSRLRDSLTRETWSHFWPPCPHWRTGLHGQSLRLVTSEGPSPHSGSWNERRRLTFHSILLARLSTSTAKTKPQVQRPRGEGRPADGCLGTAGRPAQPGDDQEDHADLTPLTLLTLRS